MNLRNILTISVLINNIFVSLWEISWIKLIIIAFTIIVILLILTIIISFYILKWLNKKIDYEYFLNDFCKETKDNLEKYGDIEVNEIYLYKIPISELRILQLNIFSFFKFNNELKNYLKTIYPIIPGHTALIFKIRLPNNQIKFLQLEKINKIKFTENISLKNNHELYKIDIENCKTINNIIKITRERMGDTMFFKWSLFNNNCQKFVKELLISIDSYNDKFSEILISNKNTEEHFSPLTIYASNFAVNLYNITEHMLTHIVYT